MTKSSSSAAAVVDNNEKKKKKKTTNNNKRLMAVVKKEKEKEEEDNDNDELLSEDDDDKEEEEEEEYKSRCDVLKRRSKRLKTLSKIYTDHYWSLIEHLKLKHTDFLWNFAKTPYASSSTCTINNNNNNNNNGKVNANNVGGGGCEMHSCKKKAMALTRFCHTHILADPKQILYKPCTYPFKSSPSGPTLCLRPILKSAVPSLCSNHLEKAEKHLSRSLRKEGFTGSNKCPPKFNVIVSEFVRQIQSDRKESL